VTTIAGIAGPGIIGNAGMFTVHINLIVLMAINTGKLFVTTCRFMAIGTCVPLTQVFP